MKRKKPYQIDLLTINKWLSLLGWYMLVRLEGKDKPIVTIGFKFCGWGRNNWWRRLS